MKSLKLDSFILYLIIGLWLLSSLIFPSQHKTFKIILISILCLVGFFKCFNSNFMIRKHLLLELSILSCVLIYYFLYNSFIGLSLNYLVIQVYIFTPVSALLIANVLSDEKRLCYLFKALLFITNLLLVFNFWFYFEQAGYLPHCLSNILNRKTAIFINNENFLVSRVGNETSLMFLIPFLFSLTAEKIIQRKRTYSLLTSCFFSFLYVLICGRRALTFVVFFSIILILLLNVLKNKTRIYRYLNKNRFEILIYAFIFLLIILLFHFKISLNVVWLTFSKSFSSDTAGFLYRVNQSIYLTHNWLNTWNTILFGNGISNGLGNYEWVYLALLYQLGIFGAFILCFSVIYILNSIWKNTNDRSNGNNFLALFVGSISFLIAGMTNPMITQLWFWCIMCTSIFYEKK